MKSRIVIDLSGLTDGYSGGVIEYARNLCGVLSENYDLIYRGGPQNYKKLNDVKFSEYWLRTHSRLRKLLGTVLACINSPKLFSKLFSDPKVEELKANDVILSIAPFFWGPTNINCKSIYFPHDFQHLHFPGFFTTQEKLLRKFNYQFIMKQFDFIAASSDLISQELQDIFNVSSDRIIQFHEPVAKLPARSEPVAARPDPKVARIFCPANFWPHKQHDLIFETINELKTSNVKFEFIFCGDTSYRKRPTPSFAHLTNINVHILGRISDADVEIEYEKCDAVLVSALYESSSIPGITGFIYGKYIIAYDSKSNLELFEKASCYPFNNKETLREAFLEVKNNIVLGRKAKNMKSEDWNGEVLRSINAVI